MKNNNIFNSLVKYFLDNRLITFIFLTAFMVMGLVTMPFNLKSGLLPRDPVPVDAIPDIGENQQIVSTEWMGRSPRDIQDQISYPLTTALLGIPGVQTIRSTSMFGMSFIYIIFKDNVEFYWSRSRILEKLNSLPSGTLPVGVQPSLGPDATALGQIYWYTLEGRDPKTGKPNGGWDPSELKTIQDFYVKYSLSTAQGVSEVASVGGFVREYQVDLNPDALKAYSVSVMDVMNSVKQSNLDIGAETIELNNVEYIIRGLGYVKSLNDLELSVVAVRNNVPVRIKDVAHVAFGPGTRRGGLDKAGSEAVGAVVVSRYGSKPMEVINNVKDKIKEIEAGLPQKTLSDGTVSKVTVVPFYDRTGLIRETIGTLESALSHEILISIIVIIVLVMNLRASLIVAGLLPFGVLMTFILMRFFGIDANIVALSGIAIAIGVMVDIGIVDVENILRHLEMPENHRIRGKKLLDVIYQATTEVRAAVVTSIATTIVSFLPVFAMQAQEGKLFHPLAFTKTFALLSAFILGIVVLPTLVHIFFNISFDSKKIKRIWNGCLIAAGFIFVIFWQMLPAMALVAVGINNLLDYMWSEKRKEFPNYINILIIVLFATWYLSIEWLPLGAHNSEFANFLFVAGIVTVILLALMSMVHFYEKILRWALENKWKFLIIPAVTLFFGLLVWRGIDKVFGFIPKGAEKIGWKSFRQTAVWQGAVTTFPGTGKEFMPSLNEGSFLLMPTSMPHSSIEKNLGYIETLDKRLAAIPEVEVAVGKWGRVNSALDPAPIQMFENTINYRSEYILDENGHRMQFKVDKKGNYILKNNTTYNPATESFRVVPADSLIAESKGEYFRQWRPQIKKPLDIWKEIVKVTDIPGLTSAPKLQPIETRLVMLSTGMRAPMGLKVYGPDLNSIEQAGMLFEKALKDVPSIKSSAVFYDRAVGAPYLEIKLNREAMARYGMTVNNVQEILQVAVGGMPLSTSVEGRERFPIRVRYARELRDNPEDLKRILVPAMNGVQIPLGEIADIEYTRGAQMIRSENTFLVGFVIFDKLEGKAEVDVVEEASKIIKGKIDSGAIMLPPGVTYKFAGNYENQLRATRRLAIVVPLSLIMILLLLYFQFRTITASFIHFSGVFVAFSGGFIMLWLYGQDWFLNFSVAGINLRDMFQMQTINLSVAVWVGFIALFGIATNDGVIMGTYIHQVFEDMKPATVHDVREAVVMAGKKRVRPAMMTTAVAVIALLPVLSSTGKGADIMVPMAIPTFGGMVIQVMTVFVVPLFQAMWREGEVTHKNKLAAQTINNQLEDGMIYKKLLILFILLGSWIAASSQQYPDSLLRYLEIAAKNNPTVLQRFNEYQAALQKIPQSGSLPDPELSAGIFLSPMELVSGNQVADLRLMQMFPWFGVLKYGKDEMSLMAKAKFELFRDAKLQVFYDVQRTWYDLYKVQKDISISEKNIEILKLIERLALVRFKSASLENSGTTSQSSATSSISSSSTNTSASGMQTMGGGQSTTGSSGSNQVSSMQTGTMGSSSGSIGLADIYRIQIESSDLENKIALLKNQQNSITAKFNTDLNRSVTTPVYMYENINMDSLEFSLAIVSDSMLAHNPMLGMLDFEKQSLEARKKMVTRMGYPMVGLGLNYSVIGKSAMSTSSMNGKDMIMPMAVFTLPIYRKKYTAMQKEADFLREATSANYKATANSLQSEYYQAVLLYQDAQRRVKLYENQSQLASKSLDLMLKSFSTSSTGLTDVLRIRQQTIDYELRQVEAVADFNTAIAWLKRLMAHTQIQ